MAHQVITRGGLGKSRNYAEILIESAADLANLEEVTCSGEEFTPCAGSVAYTANMSSVYMKSIAGTWEVI